MFTAVILIISIPTVPLCTLTLLGLHRHRGLPLMAEAVEKLRWWVAREFARFNLQETNDARGHLNDPTRRQDEVLGPSAGPLHIEGT
jgi:hypothetical protein